MSLWSRLFAAPSPSNGPAPRGVSPSRSLGRMIQSLIPKDDDAPRPELLLLGPPRGPHIEFFTHRGFRVTVEDLSELLDWARRPEPDRPETVPPGLEQPAGHFDAAVLLDVVDRVDDAGARAILDEVRRALRPGGQLFLLSDSKPEAGPQPPREVVFEGEGFRLAEGTGRAFRRRRRANRDLLALFAGLSVQQVQLRQDGIREVLLRRPSA